MSSFNCTQCETPIVDTEYGYITQCTHYPLEPHMIEKYHICEDGDVILDAFGRPIPKEVCLCYAHSISECICGAWLIPVDHKTRLL